MIEPNRVVLRLTSPRLTKFFFNLITFSNLGAENPI